MLCIKTKPNKARRLLVRSLTYRREQIERISSRGLTLRPQAVHMIHHGPRFALRL